MFVLVAVMIKNVKTFVTDVDISATNLSTYFKSEKWRELSEKVKTEYNCYLTTKHKKFAVLEFASNEDNVSPVCVEKLYVKDS